MDERFSYVNLAAGAGRMRFAAELSALLTERLRRAEEPARECNAIIKDLRDLGHDLWSFDESTDFQLWCGDYVNRKQRWELIIQLNYVDNVPPSASVDVREYPEIPH